MLTITFRYRRTTWTCLVRVEKDDIFIIVPITRKDTEENIFLTKRNGQWVGDCCDKKLIEKIGYEIDSVTELQPQVQGT